MSATLRARQLELRRKIQWMAWILIVGLLLSGITALPLQGELDFLARLLEGTRAPAGLVSWINTVRDGLHDTYARYPFIGYGTDWLAFAHIAIAIVFVGAVKHPLRHAWLFTWGMIICVLVVPWALLCGEVRQIPLGWRMIDSAFGVIGFLPCWLAARWCRELQRLKVQEDFA